MRIAIPIILFAISCAAFLADPLVTNIGLYAIWAACAIAAAAYRYLWAGKFTFAELIVARIFMWLTLIPPSIGLIVAGFSAAQDLPAIFAFVAGGFAWLCFVAVMAGVAAGAQCPECGVRHHVHQFTLKHVAAMMRGRCPTCEADWHGHASRPSA